MNRYEQRKVLTGSRDKLATRWNTQGGTEMELKLEAIDHRAAVYKGQVILLVDARIQQI
jgi:hypothetical protein